MSRLFTRNTLKQFRSISSSLIVKVTATATPTIEKLEIPLSNVNKPTNPKLSKLVTEISNLNLVEVSELSSLLKKTLNLPDTPMMSMGGFATVGSQLQAEDEDEAPKAVKSVFNVKLMKFDEKQKVALIKEIKNLMEGMNLVQAKKFVEGAPAVLKTDVSKDEANKLKEAVEKVGGVIEID